jgi:hypothetical protein
VFVVLPKPILDSVLLTADCWVIQVRRFLAGKTSGNMVDELDFAEGILRVCLGEGVRDWSWKFMARRLEERQKIYEDHSKECHQAMDRLDEEYESIYYQHPRVS